MKLSYTQTAVLRALAAGDTLKSHRFLDGAKFFKLHGLDGAEQAVRCTTVHALQRRGLITSNQKFPAATFLLTEKGRKWLAGIDVHKKSCSH